MGVIIDEGPVKTELSAHASLRAKHVNPIPIRRCRLFGKIARAFGHDRSGLVIRIVGGKLSKTDCCGLELPV